MWSTPLPCPTLSLLPYTCLGSLFLLKITSYEPTSLVSLPYLPWDALPSDHSGLFSAYEHPWYAYLPTSPFSVSTSSAMTFTKPNLFGSLPQLRIFDFCHCLQDKACTPEETVKPLISWSQGYPELHLPPRSSSALTSAISLSLYSPPPKILQTLWDSIQMSFP